MKKYLGFVAVSVFLLSCTNTDRDNPYDMWGSNYMGNASAEGSSSSVETGDEPSSSSVVYSDGSVEPFSSSALPSSSSEAESSSSVAVSSSSVVPSSSSARPSSSSVAPSSSSVTPSSSSAPPSSSSVVPSSSSNVGCAGFVDGTEREHNGEMKEQFCDERDGKKYVYVVIGDQTWMAENLNYVVEGSKCYSNSSANCDKYGSLYNWATAMALPSSCNFDSCLSQIQSPHRGICPLGYHIPSQSEWNTLSSYVQSTSGCNSCDAKLLKSTSGWAGNINGTDQYGFSALPGGIGNSDGSFYYDGNLGFWWSAYGNSNYAYYRGMSYRYDAYWNTYGMSFLFSVRCVRD